MTFQPRLGLTGAGARAARSQQTVSVFKSDAAASYGGGCARWIRIGCCIRVLHTEEGCWLGGPAMQRTASFDELASVSAQLTQLTALCTKSREQVVVRDHEIRRKDVDLARLRSQLHAAEVRAQEDAHWIKSTTYPR